MPAAPCRPAGRGPGATHCWGDRLKAGGAEKASCAQKARALPGWAWKAGLVGSSPAKRRDTGAECKEKAAIPEGIAAAKSRAALQAAVRVRARTGMAGRIFAGSVNSPDSMVATRTVSTKLSTTSIHGTPAFS